MFAGAQRIIYYYYVVKYYILSFSVSCYCVLFYCVTQYVAFILAIFSCLFLSQLLVRPRSLNYSERLLYDVETMPGFVFYAPRPGGAWTFWTVRYFRELRELGSLWILTDDTYGCQYTWQWRWQDNNNTTVAHNSNIEDNIRVTKDTTFYFTRYLYQRLLGIVIERSSPSALDQQTKACRHSCSWVCIAFENYCSS